MILMLILSVTRKPRDQSQGRRSAQSPSFVLHASHHLCESPFKDLVDVLAVAGRTGKVLETSFLGIGDGLDLLNLLGPSIVLVAHEYDDCLLEVESTGLHGSFPLGKSVEGLPVFEIKDEKYNLCSLEERSANVFVVCAATEIEEVDCYFAS